MRPSATSARTIRPRPICQRTEVPVARVAHGEELYRGHRVAESIIGLYKTEVIRPRGPWRGLEAVEFATLEWVDWFNN